MRLLVIGLVLVLVLTACGMESLQPATEPHPTRQYWHPSGVFTLPLPTSWLVGDLSDGAGLLVTFAPPGASQVQLTIYSVRLGETMDDSAFAAAIDTYLDAPHNDTLSTVERTAMGDGSWRVSGIRHVRNESHPVNVFLQRDGAFFSALEVVIPTYDDLTNAILEMAINGYEVNQEAGWPVGAVDAVPAMNENYMVSAGNLAFSGLATWVDGDGRFHVTGRIANHAPYPLEQVAVRATLYDFSGLVLGEQVSPVPGTVLLDGEYVPFDVRFDSGRPIAVTRFGLQAEAVQADASLRTFVGPGSFDWEDRAEYDDEGRLHIQGTVWNAGDAAVYNTTGVITVFDAQNQVIGYVIAEIAPGALGPGESMRFDTPLDEVGGNPARYLLALHARSQP